MIPADAIELRLHALARSGHHAIVEWILTHYPGPTLTEYVWGHVRANAPP